MERKYLAVIDIAGYEYESFEYYSEHRNKTAENMTDLKRAYRRSKGKSAYNRAIWDNTQTYLQ